MNEGGVTVTKVTGLLVMPSGRTGIPAAPVNTLTAEIGESDGAADDGVDPADVAAVAGSVTEVTAPSTDALTMDGVLKTKTSFCSCGSVVSPILVSVDLTKLATMSKSSLEVEMGRMCNEAPFGPSMGGVSPGTLALYVSALLWYHSVLLDDGFQPSKRGVLSSAMDAARVLIDLLVVPVVLTELGALDKVDVGSCGQMETERLVVDLAVDVLVSVPFLSRFFQLSTVDCNSALELLL